MNREETITALRQAGYTGPVSYTKTTLSEMLAKQRHPAGGDVTPPKPDLAIVKPDADDFEAGHVKTTTWRGLEKGHRCKVQGEKGYWEFGYYESNGERSSVAVRRKGRASCRYFAPDLILNARGKPLPADESS